MQERFITRYQILNALNNPDKLERSIKNQDRFLAKKLYFNRHLQKEHLLIIIFEKNNSTREIITIIDTSKISKYLS